MKILTLLWLLVHCAVAAIPTEGLVAYYPLNGNADDASGNDLHGIVNGPTPTTDKFGTRRSAMRFNGTTDHIRLPINTGPGAMPSVTMVAWVRSDRAGEFGYVISNDFMQRGRSIRYRPRNDEGEWSARAPRFTSLIGDSALLGEWYFVAVVYDQPGNRITLHVNDNVYQQEGQMHEGHAHTDLGRNPSFGNYFQGAIDEVRIYDRALESNEIDALYRQFLEGFPNDSEARPDRSTLYWSTAIAFTLFAGTVLAGNLIILRK